MPLFKRAKTKKDSPRIDSSIAHTGFSPPSQSAVPQVDVAATAMKNSKHPKDKNSKHSKDSKASSPEDQISKWTTEWETIVQELYALCIQYDKQHDSPIYGFIKDAIDSVNQSFSQAPTNPSEFNFITKQMTCIKNNLVNLFKGLRLKDLQYLTIKTLLYDKMDTLMNDIQCFQLNRLLYG